ncbi:MAG TPA: site-specific DNA-methyltransferase, partial [Phycisphaerae bacterium]|nr:site-specific DNA-methyltransferase [Phycisphaerae bacterium]
MRLDVVLGDCLERIAEMPADSVDAIVTDPPYGLSFMGKGWDHGVPGEPFWAEALRVAKPGAPLLAFGGTRTHHRLMCAIEDAGWEIRDCLMWLYGSGFPKSLDVSKAIDAAAGAEREVVGRSARHVSGKADQRTEGLRGTSTFQESVGMGQFLTAPATDLARRWHGYGTALKPAWEPIILARKPLAGTVAANVQQYGTGGLNIDG